MINLDNLINGLSKTGAISGFAGGLAGTAMAGALSGKQGRKMAKSALKVGALAAVGGLAYTAYQRYRQGNVSGVSGQGVQAASAAAAERSGWGHLQRERFESAVDNTEEANGGLLLIRAMIAAASADGHMDNAERNRIFAETERVTLSRDEKARLFDELREPLSLRQIALQVPNAETAVEVYAASLVAIDEKRPEARVYLEELAEALQLPEALVHAVHTQAEQARRNEAA